MAPAAEPFKLGEEIFLSGKPMRVAGWVQFEAAPAERFTRYLLAEADGAPLIIEESGESYCLLRPFVHGALPEATGGTIKVMREKYTRSSVRKLKVVGSAGQPPGGRMPKSALVVSGVFAGSMGTLLRELPAGANTQVFFSSRPLQSGDVLSAAQFAARQEAGRQAAEALGLSRDGGEAPGKHWPELAALGIATLLVIAGLVVAFLQRTG